MTLEETKLLVMRLCRNFFNPDNSTSEAPNPPPDFLALCEEIHAFNEAQGVSAGAFVSESVLGGKHSYTRAVGKDGLPIDWIRKFRIRLDAYRQHTYNP